MIAKHICAIHGEFINDMALWPGVVCPECDPNYRPGQPYSVREYLTDERSYRRCLAIADQAQRELDAMRDRDDDGDEFFALGADGIWKVVKYPSDTDEFFALQARVQALETAMCEWSERERGYYNHRFDPHDRSRLERMKKDTK